MNSISKQVTRDMSIDFRSSDGCRINASQEDSNKNNLRSLLLVLKNLLQENELDYLLERLKGFL